MAEKTASPAPAASRLSLGVSLRGFALLSVLFGLVVSGYLSYVKLSDTAMQCVQGGRFDCGTVQSSAYGEFFGVPIAVLGFLMYVTVGTILVLQGRVQFFTDFGTALLFSIGLFAWVFSMWLVYVQFFILEALCPWCLSHEANMTILFGLIIAMLWREMRGSEAAA